MFKEMMARLAGRAGRRKVVRATRWDALRQTPDLRDHWKFTDSRSVDASLDSDVRRRLREKARYEIANNSYALGAALAVANAVVGSGPRLQILNGDPEVNKRAEWDFAEWAESVRLAEKLRAMRFAKFQDGEAFGILYNNRRARTPVQLDIAPLDAERVCASYATFDPLDVDGIRLDEWGNPVSYRVLTRHPGDRFGSILEDATEYGADRVVHWYRRTSPEQHRGCSEIAASLPLFALLRRYTRAVVQAAETAADLSLVFYTDAIEDAGGGFGDYGAEEEPVPDSTGKDSPFAEIPFTGGMTITAPVGFKPSQIKAEQPTTTYPEFKRELLGEIGRSLQIPVNIIAGDSARYNYASGRLDHQEFQKAIRLDQSNCGVSVMRPVFDAWWREWTLVNGIDDRRAPSVCWYFDGFEHVDPNKEANAQATRLASGTTTLATEYGKQGLDWEDQLIQRAREVRMMRELGLATETAPVDSGDDEEREEDRAAK